MLYADQLVKGKVYFMVQYEDRTLAKPMVGSYEYIGRPDKDSPERLHIFRILGSDEHLFLAEAHLDLVDLPGLISELQRFQVAGKGTLDDAS